MTSKVWVSISPLPREMQPTAQPPWCCWEGWAGTMNAPKPKMRCYCSKCKDAPKPGFKPLCPLQAGG
jgi:hypothetical protein